jgi:hypothetical protein
VCSSSFPADPPGCAIPSTTNPQEVGCPREQPAYHEDCRAAKFGLNCTYTDWTNLPGIFFYCTCSYHGWSCTKGNYAH